MEGLALLRQAQDLGLEVRAEGTILVVSGPRSAESLANRLLASKAEALAVLTLPEWARPLVA